MHESYYQILDIDRNAGDEAIKHAFRRMAMLHHPDRNPGDQRSEQLFGLALEAYQVLKDPELRRLYDNYGQEGLKAARFQTKTGLEDLFSSFAEVFEGLFTVDEPPRQLTPQRGRNLGCTITLGLAEVIEGREVQVEVPVDVTCPACRGRGHRSGGRPEICPDCHGAGRQTRPHGFFRLAGPCSRCHGRGRIYPDTCPQCKGEGHTRVVRKVPVLVPRGIEHGEVLHLGGQGHPGRNGGEPGDLKVRVELARHPYFQRRGRDLLRSLSISPRRARTGGLAPVRTLADGLQFLGIPAGAADGEELTLKGLGLADRDGIRGDLVLRLEVSEPGRPAVCLSCARHAQRRSDLARSVYGLYMGRGGNRIWALIRLDHPELPPAPDLDRAGLDRRLALILAYLRSHLQGGGSFSQPERQALLVVARHLEQRAGKERDPRLARSALAFADLMAEILAEGEVAEHLSGPNGRFPRCDLGYVDTGPEVSGLPAISYRELQARSQAALTDRFLDRYVVNIFAYPRKWLVRRKFLGIMTELFEGIEKRAAGGGDLYDAVDVAVSAFVSRHRVLLKSLVLNYSRQSNREVTLYQFESFLAESLRHFYMVLKMHQKEDPRLIRGVPPQLRHHQ